MKVDERLLDDLLVRMRAAGLRELEVAQDGLRIVMRLPVAPRSARDGKTASVEVTTTGMGVFHLAHPHRPDDKRAQGQRVSAGEILGYLQAGQTLIAIRAPVAGTIASIDIGEGVVAGYGQRVMTLGGDE